MVRDKDRNREQGRTTDVERLRPRDRSRDRDKNRDMNRKMDRGDSIRGRRDRVRDEDRDTALCVDSLTRGERVVWSR